MVFTKTQKKKNKSKKKPSKSSDSSSPPSKAHKNTQPTRNITWSSNQTRQEPLCTSGTILTILGVLLVIFMANLYFFVEDANVPVQQQPQPTPEAPKNFTRPPRRPTFDTSEEVDIVALQTLIREMDDRILIVAFEEANAEGNKQKLWKRWERIARAIPKKSQFRRLDEDEYPKVVRFDCSTPDS